MQSNPIQDQQIISSPYQKELSPINLRDSGSGDPLLMQQQQQQQAEQHGGSMLLETIAEQGASPHQTRTGMRDQLQYTHLANPSMWSQQAQRHPPRPAVTSHYRQLSKHSGAGQALIDDFQKSLQGFKYNGQEDGIICGQFPHLMYNQSTVDLNSVKLIEVYPGIIMGPLQAAFKTKDLIKMKVTHILNCSCQEYAKRTKFFKYLNIQIYDNTKEKINRHFRITNRFIHEARQESRILVHSVQGKSRAAAFILAYLIAKERIKLKDGLAILREKVPEVEPNDYFLQQLSEYDLQLLSKY